MKIDATTSLLVICALFFGVSTPLAGRDAVALSDKMIALSKIGSHYNEEVSIMFVPSRESVFAWIAPRTHPPFIGFVSPVRIEVTNVDALPSTHALSLSKKNGDRSVFADFVISYVIDEPATQSEDGIKTFKARILSVAEGVQANWQAFEDYKAEGLHRHVPATLRVQRRPDGAPAIQFIPLSLHSRGWPRSGAVSVKNPEIVPLPALDKETIFLDYLVSYRIELVSNGPVQSHTAQIIMLVPIDNCDL